MMSNIKFQECLINNNIYTIEEIIKIYNKDREGYQEKCYNSMFCPECNQAELAFHPNAISPYFSKKPKSHHKGESNGEAGCSHSYEEATKKLVTEYYNNKENCKGINRKLKSCLDLLIKPKNKNLKGDGKIEKGTIINKGTFVFDNGNKRFAMRRKKINIHLEDRDYGIPILFYGTAKIRWRENKYDEYSIWYMQLRNITNNKFLCSIKVTPKVYKLLDGSIKNMFDEEYNIAFMSEMEQNGVFNNCKLEEVEHIVIERVKI